MQDREELLDRREHYRRDLQAERDRQADTRDAALNLRADQADQRDRDADQREIDFEVRRQ